MEMVSSIFAWIGANPSWAGVGVFLIAFFESLALVGLVLPGAAMMFAIGAMIGTDTLPLWPTLVWAAAGAIAGDGVSFWLGRRYHLQLKTLWPLRNHPELITNATGFFYRHGGKSILLGRFIGPIRPVIPAVAGMLEMPVRRFLAFNIISGILWAPVYVFPGILFATSLGLAAEVASRLAVLIGTAIGLLIVVLWLSRILFNRVHRYAYPLIQRSLEWARLHPRMGEIPAALLDPAHPEARGLTLLALLLLLASTLFALVVQALGHEGLLYNLDSYLLNTFEALRTPLGDTLFVSLAQLGDWQVLLPLALAVLFWLWRHRYRHAARHWLAAVGIGALLSLNLLWLEAYAGGPLPAPLHTGQLMTAMAVYGFVAILIAREYPENRRWPIYAIAATLILGIALARLYLGASRLSGVMGAITLGLAWIALLGIAYRNHPAERVAHRRLAAIALLTLALAAGWHGLNHHGTTLERYAIRLAPLPMQTTTWWQGGWQRLPAYRADLRGVHDHPLNLQFAGDPEVLAAQLQRSGWHPPQAVTALNWLTWLNPDTPLSLTPVLPQVHNGHNERLLLVKEDAAQGAWLALRLWPSRYRALPDGKPLWIGNVSLLRPDRRSLISAPRTQDDFDTPLTQLRQTPLAMEAKTVERQSHTPGWRGEALLLRQTR